MQVFWVSAYENNVFLLEQDGEIIHARFIVNFSLLREVGAGFSAAGGFSFE